MGDKLRTVDDITEAIKACQESLVLHALELPPRLTLALPTILEGLEELLGRRIGDNVP